MTITRLGKKILKIIGIIVGSLLVLLTAFHFWVVAHAEEILEDFVYSKSNGKIKLEVANFKFNWFSRKMELQNAVFITTDSVESGASYRFAVKEIKLRVKAVIPMVFRKQVRITNLTLNEPDITVVRLRKKQTAQRDTSTTDNSIPAEMGRIYLSIQDALKVLEVKKFEINNAKFTLVNKIDPDAAPITIGRIDFHIDNLFIDTAKFTPGQEKVFFSDNIVLKSRDQDILFPDRRHRLSYRKFRINIEKKIVEFDSCTIAALKTDSSSTGFSIFFDELQLTNINFDTLYRKGVIKADSVYCVNPTFKLDVDLDRRKEKRRQAPKMDQIIRQLTGDLMLNFVIVNNASFDVSTTRNGRPSSFTSKGNNFAIQGLSIDHDRERPLKVEKFAMAIRNYENFLRDSTYEMQFDSVMVNDDRILLNNFSFVKLVNGKTINRFKVPIFQLTGLSWDDLLFEQKLTAKQAVLYHPTILFTEQKKSSGANRVSKKQNIFNVLAEINQVISLEDLKINDGDIVMHLTGGTDLNLTDATLNIQSGSLLGSSKISGIRRSVNQLDFTKGTLKTKDLSLQFDNVKFTGKESHFKADRVSVFNDDKTVDANASGVTMNGIFINTSSGDVIVDKINWDQADINLHRFGSNRGKSDGASFIDLTDITGRNTRINATIGTKKVTTFVNNISAAAVILQPGELPILADVSLSGRDLTITDKDLRMSASSYMIDDEKKASFENLYYRKRNGTDSMEFRVPALSFVPRIQALIQGNMFGDEMIISNPVIKIAITKKEDRITSQGLSLPTIRTNKLSIQQPVIRLSQQTAEGTVNLEWKGNNTKSNSIVFLDVQAGDTAFLARQLYLSLNSFTYQDAKGKSFDAGRGEITALLNDIYFRKIPGSELQWSAALATLDGKDFILDSLGKKAGRLEINTVQLKDLSLNSASLLSMKKLLEQNKSFRLQQITGSFGDTVSEFKWYNAGYDKSSKFFSLDSFSFVPKATRDAFVASHPYQTDYIRLKTGAMAVGPFDIEKYLSDTIVSIGTMKIDNVIFTDYRDNRPPFRSGTIKDLTAMRIQKIPIKLAIDTLLMDNAHITYTEVNPKTNQEGVIPITRMTIRAFPVRNFDLGPTDSLRIHANGYLMDSIWVRLRLRESYRDTLSGFLVTVRMRPTDMRVLNPVLLPLASARIKTGFLDTISMRTAGNDQLAFGEMNMSYHDFRVELFKPGTTNKMKLLTFLANTFIKNKNTKRSGTVFYVRNREKSSLNYLIKMFMSGVTSSLGVKGNRKQIRKYKKELRDRNMLPFDSD